VRSQDKSLRRATNLIVCNTKDGGRGRGIDSQQSTVDSQRSTVKDT